MSTIAKSILSIIYELGTIRMKRVITMIITHPVPTTTLVISTFLERNCTSNVKNAESMSPITKDVMIVLS